MDVANRGGQDIENIASASLSKNSDNAVTMSRENPDMQNSDNVNTVHREHENGTVAAEVYEDNISSPDSEGGVVVYSMCIGGASDEDITPHNNESVLSMEPGNVENMDSQESA